MKSTALIVPYRPDGGLRDRNWGILRTWWEDAFPDMQICVGMSSRREGPWIKAVAAERAVAQAKADVLVVADADVWPHPAEAVSEAVDLAASGEAPWVVPHKEVRRLSPEASYRALHCGTELSESLPLAERAYSGMPGGGLLVITAEAWRQIGGYDPRFRGWGGEDSSLGRTANTLLGNRHRLHAALYHFWHPPEPRLNRITGSTATYRLTNVYKRAVYRPAVMRSLVRNRPATPP